MTQTDQDEIFVVVDRNDRIRGYYSRYECHHNKQLIHRAIGVVVYNDKGQVLLQKRSKNKDFYPGFYTVAASGHVSKGETYRQTAKRELFEELGIRSPLTKEKKFLFEMDLETEMDCLFSTKFNGPFYPNKQEIDEIKFVTASQLQKMLPKLTPFAITNFKQLELLS